MTIVSEKLKQQNYFGENIDLTNYRNTRIKQVFSMKILITIQTKN